MKSVVLKIYFDGVWETLEDGRMDYENVKVTAFCFQKDATFEQFITMLYGILKKSSDEYSPTVKTNMKSTHPTQPIDSLPINIVDDEIVRVIMRMNSDPINYRCTSIYVMTTPKVLIELPLMPSIQTLAFEHYSLFRSHNDPIDDNVVNTNVYNMYAEINNIQSEMNFRHCNSLINIVEDIDRFQEVNDSSQNHFISPRTYSQSRYVSPMAHSRSRSRVPSPIDPLQLEAPIVLSNWVASDMTTN